MGDLSKNFSRSEFACKGTHCCGHSAPVHPYLIKALQALREHLNLPLRITSGFRCNSHNVAVGGAPHSYHTLGMAADVTCNELSADDLAQAAKAIKAFKKGGIGIYKAWVHLDVRRVGSGVTWSDE